MTTEAIARRYRVRGRVQGVGFRAFVWREAQAIEVRGWVRNVADGTVEALAAGQIAALERLEEVLRQGPRWSRVQTVEGTEASLDELAETSFTIRGDTW